MRLIHPKRLFVYSEKLFNRINEWFWLHHCRRQLKSYGTNLLINGKSHFNGNIEVGDDCNFNGMYIQGGGHVKIGNNFHSGIECMMITSKHSYEGDLIPYDYTAYQTNIDIGDYVWFGNRVTIVGPVKIGKGAIIGTCAVITKDVPDYAIMGGLNKLLKYRNQEHFEKLEKEGKVWKYKNN